MDSDNHPVWEVYDAYRDARLNAKYYACKLDSLSTRNNALETVAAITAPIAVVSGFVDASALDVPYLVILWGGLGLVASAAAIYKPVAKLTERVRALEEVVSKYRAIEFDLKSIANDIVSQRAYGPDLRARFNAVHERTKQLALSMKSEKVDHALARRMANQVKAELPTSSFYIPPDHV